MKPRWVLIASETRYYNELEVLLPIFETKLVNNPIYSYIYISLGHESRTSLKYCFQTLKPTWEILTLYLLLPASETRCHKELEILFPNFKTNLGDIQYISSFTCLWDKMLQRAWSIVSELWNQDECVEKQTYCCVL